MTPKEKAEKLIEEFMPYQDDYYNDEPMDGATSCALIAVDLLMEEAYRQHDYEGFIAYWKEVKQEIENYG
jgi:hypothetical protein